MYLQDVKLYRDTIVEQLLSNEAIVELIRPEDAPFTKPRDLLYKHIYPYDHIIEKTTEAETFLCFDIEAPRIIGRAFTEFRIYFWIMTHDRRIVTPKGLRGDLLSSEIEKVMNGSKDFGIGRVELKSWGRFAPAEKFHGRSLIYETVDFNRE